MYEKNVINEWITRFDEFKEGMNCVCTKMNKEVFGVGNNSGEFCVFRIAK